MFENTIKSDIEQQPELIKTLESLDELASLQLLMIGGGTGAVNLE